MSSSREDSNRDDRIEEDFSLFCEAWLDGEEPDEEALYDKHPSRATELRARVHKFLSMDRYFKGGGWKTMQRSAVSPGDDDEVSGKTLGDFRLIREVGRGGMGVVYEARQISLDRIVALKVLPSHLTLRQDSIARFKSEASTASRLKHPNIVDIHAISEAEGNHFFVMDFVDGTPLNHVLEYLLTEDIFPRDGGILGEAVMKGMHCRTDRTSPEGFDKETDELHGFWNRTYIETICRIILQVAEALEYTHSSGVVHRDVKPSNILLKADGTVILTDFGLAREGGLPSLTMTGELAGTPYYIAPEQVSHNKKALDHRVDIYSMGVTLYELLTLTRPYTGETSQEILGKIVSKDPHSPRTKNPLIPRDLETICLTAMEKEPARRYQSAKEFRDDLMNFLHFRPIKAHPAGVLTRTMRVIRRNPASSTLVGLLVLIVIAGPLLFGIQQKRAKGRVEEALNIAEEEKAKANKVADFLARVFQGSNPANTMGRTMTAYDLLMEGVETIESELEDNPLVKARLMRIMHISFNNLGYLAESEKLARKALDIYRRELGEENDLTLWAMEDLGTIQVIRGRFVEAERLLSQALETFYRINGEFSGPSSSDLALELTEALGRAYKGLGKITEAENIFTRVIVETRSSPNFNSLKVSYCYYWLSFIYMEWDRYDEAEALLKECLQNFTSTSGTDEHFKTLLISALGNTYSLKKNYDEAERFLLKAHQRNIDLWGDDHRITLLNTTAMLVSLYTRMGRLDEAEMLCLQILQGLVLEHEEYEPKAYTCFHKLADIYILQDRFDEAERLLIECATHLRKRLTDDPRNIPILLVDTGFIFNVLGCTERALSCCRAALAAYRQNCWYGNPKSEEHLNKLAYGFQKLNCHQEAEEAILYLLEHIPETEPSYFNWKFRLGIARTNLDQVDRVDSRCGWDHPRTLISEHESLRVLTTVDEVLAKPFVYEGEKTLKELKRRFPAYKANEDYSITLCIASDLDEYNRFGDTLGDEKSSNYPVHYMNDDGFGSSISVTYLFGTDEAHSSFTSGWVRHAVTEQYFHGMDTEGRIPAWFIKGQAARFERYFHPEFIKWSIDDAIFPLGGLTKFNELFSDFTFTEKEIHTAGLVCAFLERLDSNDVLNMRYEDALHALRDLENVSVAFEKLEETLVKEEARIHDYMESFSP